RAPAQSPVCRDLRSDGRGITLHLQRWAVCGWQAGRGLPEQSQLEQCRRYRGARRGDRVLVCRSARSRPGSDSQGALSRQPRPRQRTVGPCVGSAGRGVRAMTERTYRACSIRRDRRTRAEIDDIKAGIAAILKADHPMTVRQVFYQLVVRALIEKSEKEYQG